MYALLKGLYVLLEQWRSWEYEQAAREAEALTEYPNARRVVFNDDPAPHWGAMIHAHCLRIQNESGDAVWATIGHKALTGGDRNSIENEVKNATTAAPRRRARHR